MASTSQSAASFIEDIRSIDGKITRARKDLSIALVEGNALLINILLWGAVSLGIILLGISVLLFFRFSRSIKAWHQQISISEQRYKSLFQQNPHAVFSMDYNGKILQGNATFTNIFKSDDAGETPSCFSELMTDNDPEGIEKILKEVRQGNPHSFESQWQKNGGNSLYLHHTILSIIVDEKIAGLFGISEDVTFNKNAEVKIKQQLKEKTVLLAEIHHRVKNNFAVISGLLHLQKASLQDEAAIKALTEARTRIQSIAMIHEKIYQSDTLAAINLCSYIEELTTMIAHSFDSHKKAIDLHLNVEDVSVTLDQSIPCGLIINELICNAYEHAFEGKTEGNIWVSIKESDGKLALKLVDDGVGLPDSWEKDRMKSLGLTLVETLTQQINGTLSIDTKPRTMFEIKFSEQ